MAVGQTRVRGDKMIGKVVVNSRGVKEGGAEERKGKERRTREKEAKKSDKRRSEADRRGGSAMRRGQYETTIHRHVEEFRSAVTILKPYEWIRKHWPASFWVR